MPHYRHSSLIVELRSNNNEWCNYTKLLLAYFSCTHQACGLYVYKIDSPNVVCYFFFEKEKQCGRQHPQVTSWWWLKVKWEEGVEFFGFIPYRSGECSWTLECPSGSMFAEGENKLPKLIWKNNWLLVWAVYGRRIGFNFFPSWMRASLVFLVIRSSL